MQTTLEWWIPMSLLLAPYSSFMLLPERSRTSDWALSSFLSTSWVRLGFVAVSRSATILTSVMSLPMMAWAISSSSKW